MSSPLKTTENRYAPMPLNLLADVVTSMGSQTLPSQRTTSLPQDRHPQLNADNQSEQDGERVRKPLRHRTLKSKLRRMESKRDLIAQMVADLRDLVAQEFHSRPTSDIVGTKVAKPPLYQRRRLWLPKPISQIGHHLKHAESTQMSMNESPETEEERMMVAQMLIAMHNCR